VGGSSQAGNTLPATSPGRGIDVARGPCLFLVAQGNSPLAPPAGLRLAALDQVHIRRGAQREMAARPVDARQVDVVLADPRVSATHARFTCVGQRWHVEDCGSRNGTFVNGTLVERAALVDGDVIDAGQALFRYRERITQDGDVVIRPPALPCGLISLLPEIHRQLDELARMARSTLTLLIEGETGTGKEVAARLLHALSGRTGAFVAVNCGALPRERVAAELFGWKRGAFPSANADHLGLVRAADGGTLFLDEIGDLPLADQATLLRVLQEREVLPIAATRVVPVDLRVIAATHQPLDELAAVDHFRSDLLARLTGFRAILPPLRDRREDLGLLVAEILRQRQPTDADPPVLHIAALRALVNHPWRANIRELDQAIARALVRRAAGQPIEAQHLLLSPVSDGDQGILNDRHGVLRGELIALLRTHEGNVTAVARAMGKARMQIQRWLKRFDLDPGTFRR
jgi:transcriptional regulator with GAF, ATPase, and Fis domain